MFGRFCFSLRLIFRRGIAAALFGLVPVRKRRRDGRLIIGTKCLGAMKSEGNKSGGGHYFGVFMWRLFAARYRCFIPAKKVHFLCKRRHRDALIKN